MPKDWTDEEVQNEIREAVRIVNEDKLTAHIRNHFKTPANDPNNPPNDPPGSGGNDPKNGNGGDKKKRSLWWGTEE